MRNWLFACVAVWCVDGVAQNAEFAQTFSKTGHWKVGEGVESFDPQTLYDHIDGASDFYLGYRFQHLWVATFTNPQGQALTLEVYKHADANCAFGIYVEERPDAVSLIKIGNEGFVTDGAAYFWMGDSYVKVFSGDPAPPTDQLVEFAKLIAGNICDTASVPAQLAWFPNGKIDRSERYVADNFLGRKGFDNVFTASYLFEGQKFKLFVLSGNEAQTTLLLDKYLSDCGAKKNAINRYILKDPLNGKVMLVQKGGYLVGLVGHPKPEKAISLVDELLAKIGADEKQISLSM